MLWSTPKENQEEHAVELAKKADIVILALGLNERLEGEEMRIKVEGFERGDRTKLDLPKTQENLMKAIAATGKPVVLVLVNGGALAINWAADHFPAIVSAGDPRQQGGKAVADVLFGDYNPAGRLPITYYKSIDQLPPFEDYNMKGRIYRYFNQEPLFPFGFGLSYTKFSYTNFKIPSKIEINKPITVSVTVSNIGDWDGDEVIELYLKDEKSSTPRPNHQLIGFKRVHFKKGEQKEIQFTIQPRQLSLINNKNELAIEPGWFTMYVGGEQPNVTNKDHKNSTKFISKRIKVIGNTKLITF